MRVLERVSDGPTVIERVALKPEPVRARLVPVLGGQRERGLKLRLVARDPLEQRLACEKLAVKRRQQRPADDEVHERRCGEPRSGGGHGTASRIAERDTGGEGDNGRQGAA